MQLDLSVSPHVFYEFAVAKLNLSYNPDDIAVTSSGLFARTWPTRSSAGDTERVGGGKSRL